ncbi:Uma2 family endonuclease [Paractinoplanes rhizophilus]|uniref:Uma2 family endonuclease n=1 Tax=Paractinoplanes rhizophilus TaxID=1416877 RepID=A0ABW2HQN9_9ACTN|nr:Uma2 family endonuclease [Actinoplanes sp.]
MREQPLDLSRTWTEAEYLALGALNIRTELVDWKIQVSPSPSNAHQGISRYLANFLEPAARAAGLTIFEAVDTRIGPGTIVCPDVVAGKLRWGKGVNDAADVILVAEVTSPSNAAWDRRGKMRRYAAARIPWYLLAEPELPELLSVTLRLHRLEGARYVEHAVARPGAVLRSDEPFPIAIDTGQLIGPLG